MLWANMYVLLNIHVCTVCMCVQISISYMYILHICKVQPFDVAAIKCLKHFLFPTFQKSRSKSPPIPSRNCSGKGQSSETGTGTVRQVGYYTIPYYSPAGGLLYNTVLQSGRWVIIQYRIIVRQVGYYTIPYYSPAGGLLYNTVLQSGRLVIIQYRIIVRQVGYYHSWAQLTNNLASANH